jgi:hypothetical protein
MIDVRIEELVLDGVGGLEPAAIRAATEAELAKPRSLVPRLPVRFGGQRDASQVGRELASTIRREVTAATSRPTGAGA